MLTGLLSLLALAGCTQQDGVSHIETLGDLPVLNAHGSPIVGVTINGHDAAMIVDSGADLSMISEKPSKAFGLTDTGRVLHLSCVTGEMFSPVVEAEKIGLGSGTSGTVYLTEAKRTFGGMIAGRPVVGLFGADFLAAHDVMFDLPARKIGLYNLRGCQTPTPEWQGPSSKLDWYRLGAHGIRIGMTMRLNGKKIDTELDSGASHTSMLPGQARRAGVSKAEFGQDLPLTSTGVNGESKGGGHLHRFASLQIGDELYPAPMLAVSPIETDGSALLGADFLRHNRVWISYRDEALYIQRLTPPERDSTFELRLRQKNPAGAVIVPVQRLPLGPSAGGP